MGRVGGRVGFGFKDICHLGRCEVGDHCRWVGIGDIVVEKKKVLLFI
jgi:hypothetical protein